MKTKTNLLPAHYTKAVEPNFQGRGCHSVNALEDIAEGYKELVHQLIIERQELWNISNTSLEALRSAYNHLPSLGDSTLLELQEAIDNATGNKNVLEIEPKLLEKNKMVMDIKNKFGKSISKSQQKWLDKIIEQEGDKIIDIALTRGGYISVDYKRDSKEYPYGREVRGLKGGWISSLQGKEYDFENGWIINGIIHDSLFGIKKFTLE